MKKTAKRLLQTVGIEVQRSNLYSRDDLRLQKFFDIHEIDTVLDVGANKGQFALELLNSGFKGKVVSFEALPDVYEQLQQNAAEFGERWTVAPRCALSDEKGTVEFHVTHNLASSSMLAPSDILVSADERFTAKQVIEVDCDRLDDMIGPLGINPDNLFLKLDVQGGEKKVLAGAPDMVSKARGILLEMSLRALYDGQPLAGELDLSLVDMGFELWDIQPMYRDPHTGRLDQYDAIYFRSTRTGSIEQEAN